jgi:hypothetical protein
MNEPIAVLSLPDSPIAERIEEVLSSDACCGADGQPCSVARLDLDAALNGAPVTIEPGGVRWQGVNLLDAGVVLLERPVFPWPQPQRLRDSPAGPHDETGRRTPGDRHARSLALSALQVVASARPVINPPEAAHLAVAPMTALDRLSQAGLEVHPWCLAPFECVQGGPTALRDAAGADRWHAPRLRGGREAVVFPERRSGSDHDAMAGGVVELLVIGDRVAGGVRHDDPSTWLTGGDGQPEAGPQPASTELAVSAAHALGLGLAGVTIGSGPEPVVVWADAGPDLVRWDRLLGGGASAALAHHLLKIASGTKKEAR